MYLLQMYLLQVYLLQVYLPQVYLLADRHAGKPRPFGAKMQHFAHLIDELRSRIVVPPASSGAKFDEVPLPTLNQSEPAAGDTVVRALLPFRHEGSQTAVKSALLDTQRALLIRATEMNAATSRLFVDFLFVDNCGANRFDCGKSAAFKPSSTSKYDSDHDLTATMPSISTEI